MTLKEIEKIIDEANFYLVSRGNKDENIKAFSVAEQGTKKSVKNAIEYDIKIGCSFIFFKLNYNYEVENRWVVDHIDKEKKVIKKKLDEMSEKEIKELAKLYCKNRFNCDDCPLHAGELGSCLTDYVSWKEAIKKYKDKEFEVEVEE